MSRDRAEPLTLRCRHVLPMEGRPLENGWISIRRGRIVAIGRGRPSGPCADLGDVIILPGLVNAHTHLEFSACTRPLDPGGGLPAWIERVVQMRRSRAAGDADAVKEEVVHAIALGLAESAAAGVTVIGEIATDAPASAYAPSGPRVRAYREGLGLAPSAGSRVASRIQKAIDSGDAGGLHGISPHAPYSVAAPLGRRLVDMARRRAIPMAMHVAESRDEADLLAAGTGRFRAMLDSLGAWPEEPPRFLTAADWITLLARSPRGMVVHGTFLPEDPVAMARLAKHRGRLCVAVCPRTTRSLSGTLPPVRAFRDAGIRVAIGTDSRASSPDLSVLAECRTLADAGLASAEETLHMATRHGAWATHLEHRSGLLAPGRPADLAILSPTMPHADPFAAALDPATQVIATSRSGRWIHRSEIFEPSGTRSP
ncbi:MAG: amidohydrolase family protein [Planctomycetia bacterium]